MKKMRRIIIAVAIATLFISCSSSKQEDPISPDSYDDSLTDIETVDSEETDFETKTGTKETSSKTQKKKSTGFSLANLFESKFYEYDQTTLFAEGTFGGIKQQNGTVIYYPKTGNVGFGSPIMAAYYYLTFDADARKKLEKAVDMYLSDFENKKLNRKGKKTYKSYGTLKTTMYWGTIKTSSPNNAKAVVNLGYEFEKNSPYFKLTIFPTTNALYENANSSVPEKSIMVSYYFTKAQAQSLVNCLSDERVQAAINAYELEKYGIDADIDDYDDNEDYTEIEEIEEDPTEVTE